MKDTHSGFAGTYFNKDRVMRISTAGKVLAWGILGIYGLQFVLGLWADLSQLMQGFWTGMRLADVLQNFLTIFLQLATGGVYFFIVMGIAQLMLIFLDVEDNTRRAARQ